MRRAQTADKKKSSPQKAKAQRHPTRLSQAQIKVLLLGIEYKLTRLSIGWLCDDGVTLSDRAYSPATVASLYERGLLDSNFVDLRVIYGARGLIDMKNLDGARHANAPEIPKFQVWTNALGRKVLTDKGLLPDNLPQRDLAGQKGFSCSGCKVIDLDLWRAQRQRQHGQHPGGKSKVKR